MAIIPSQLLPTPPPPIPSHLPSPSSSCTSKYLSPFLAGVGGWVGGESGGEGDVGGWHGETQRARALTHSPALYNGGMLPALPRIIRHSDF